MADTDDEQQPQGGGKKKLIIIILAVVILLGGGGGAAFFFLMGSDSSDMTTVSAAPAEEVILPANYINIPEPFIFNVSGKKRQRMVQVKIQLMVRGDENEKLAMDNMPLIEHTLLTSLAAATVEQLRTAPGQLEVRKQAADAVKAAMQKVVEKSVVERVLFTDFVMQ
ncbi:flagellar basal body-associated protein FliL [Parasalinivibrio latis]|uniref:flagellar basal body-associated protein FliL n=1 Tax=Parasalinivibrio latis TaxID=2952610 RepID=UPI0030E37C05